MTEASEHINTASTDPFLSIQDGGTEVYLIRHGDALPNADEVVSGNYDDQGLSALGRRQVLALTKRMLQISPIAIYSRPIVRTRQTASAVGETLGFQVNIDPELREFGLGSIGSQHLDNVSPLELPNALRAYLHEIEHVGLSIRVWSSIPGTETSNVLRARITRAIESIANKHSGNRIAIVSHTVAINAYIAEILHLERDFFFPAANTSISVVRVKGQRYLLLVLNDYAHLWHEGLIE